MRVLTREELTATLAHRQGLITRWDVSPQEAIKRLTPLQGQEASAPFVALAARVEGFTRDALEQAITDRHVVKSTLMRLTLHLASGEDFPAYAALLPALADAQVARDRPAGSTRRPRSWPRGSPRPAPTRTSAPRSRRRTCGRRSCGPARWCRSSSSRPPATTPTAAGTRCSSRTRARCPRRRRPPKTVLTRYLDRVRPRPEARPRGLGRRRPARLRLRRRRHRQLPGRARPHADRPAGRRDPARRHAAPAALSRQLGPAAARLQGPRSDPAAGGPAAPAHALRRPDAHRRRPRRRQLDGGGRPHDDHAAHRIPTQTGSRRKPCARPGSALPHARTFEVVMK